MDLSPNYIFFSFLFITQCDIFNMSYFAIIETHLMGVNIGFSLMTLHIEKENTL